MLLKNENGSLAIYCKAFVQMFFFTSGAGTAYPPGAPEFTSGFQ
jgi:hypothetical protein